MLGLVESHGAGRTGSAEEACEVGSGTLTAATVDTGIWTPQFELQIGFTDWKIANF